MRVLAKPSDFAVLQAKSPISRELPFSKKVMSLSQTSHKACVPYDNPAPAPAPAQDPITEDPGSNGGCPPAGSTTEEACKAAGCTWVPGWYQPDVSTTGGVCVPTPEDPNMPKKKECHHHEYVCKYNHHDGHCCEYKCVGSHDSCHALPGGKVESKAGGSAWEDSDGARGWTVFAAATAVLAAVAF